MEHSAFVPHGYCLLWNWKLIWLDIVSNSIVALSYYSIPLMLLLLVTRRGTSLVLRPVLILFALFIVFCGGGHALDIVSIWHPIYWTKAWWNAGTALFSGLTGIVLIPKTIAFLELSKSKDRLEREAQYLTGKNSLLRAVLDSVLDGIVLVAPNGAFEVVNEAAQGLARDGSLKLEELCPPLKESTGPIREVIQPNPNVFIDRFRTSVRGHGQLYILRDITEMEKSRRWGQQLASIVESSHDSIITKNPDGFVLTWNPGSERMFGYSAQEAIGQHISFLVPQCRRDELAVIMKKLTNGEHIDDLETIRVRKDGCEIPVSVSLTPISGRIGGFPIVSAISRDRTMELEHQKHLEQSLKEKEVMLKEIHHRVKNNLQVIGSLLYMQTEYMLHEECRARLQECRDRVRAMTLVHERLYQADDLSSIDIREYIAGLVNHLRDVWGQNTGTIRLTIDVEHIRLNIERSIACGLILNELVTNSLKYAFPTRTYGEIRISLGRTSPGLIQMRVADDGVGFPQPDIKQAKSLGLEIVRALSTQLKAQLEIRASAGSEFTFVFPET